MRDSVLPSISQMGKGTHCVLGTELGADADRRTPVNAELHAAGAFGI